MKKQNLVRIILTLIISGALMTFISCEKPVRKNIGLQLYSLRDSMKTNPVGTIQKVGKMGYKFVETAGYNNGLIYGMDPVEFKKVCEANGLQFLGAHVGQPVPDSASWNETMAWWDKCIDAHVAAGAKWLVQPSMGGDVYQNIETLKRYCNYFNAVGEKCKAKGLVFGYHNHDKEFSTQLDNTVIYDFMLRNTDPEKVMFQLDLYWCVVGGKNPVDYFNNYPGRFYLWHIKDKEEIGASGMMDFASMFAAAKVSGMKYGIVEVERYNFEPTVSCKMSIDYLNKADYVVLP